ncbi:MAG: hypothetical protein LBI86_04380 [Treponema sp.]|nr:hypothetical protein [Treponema sp.]
MYILAFDIGTSAIKSTLVSLEGRIIDSVSKEYPVTGGGQGRAEQDPLLWWEGASVTSRKLLERNRDAARKIDVVGVSGHMLGCLPVDVHCNPLRPAMIHADVRAAGECNYIRDVAGPDELYRRTGSILSVQNTLCKILWIRNNEPDIYKNTVRFLQSKDFLTAKITGNIDTTDLSDASHAQVIDIHSKKYMDDVFRELSLDAGKFPALHRGTDITGRVSKQAGEALGIQEGIPVIAGGGDGACANLGAGITAARGEVYGNIGTTAWLAYGSAAPVIDGKSRVFNIISLDGDSFGVFGAMQAAGKCVEWARSLLAIESGALFDAEAGAAPPGSGSLLFLPYIDGERSPIFDANARGVFFNIDSNHKRSHFARAVLEGVGFALRSILEVIRENTGVSQVRIIGGGAKSRLWLQIIADICGADVLTMEGKADSITSLGVALAAAVGIGAYKTIDDAALVMKPAEKIPCRREYAAVYDGLYEKYLSLYSRVKDLYPAG